MSIQQQHHNLQRIKNKRRNYWGRDLSKEPKYLGMACSTTNTCNCFICRNDRLNGKITLKEKINKEEFTTWQQN